MTALQATATYAKDVQLLVLARDIAMDVYDLEKILEHHSISSDEWTKLQRNPKFVQLLESELVAWNTAVNTNERVKVKSSAMLEEWLPELYERILDRAETLNSKIEGGKLLAKLAGLGINAATVEGAMERFSITINLGADSQLKFNKDSQMKTIEALPSDE